jgi:hypothetical protein
MNFPVWEMRTEVAKMRFMMTEMMVMMGWVLQAAGNWQRQEAEAAAAAVEAAAVKDKDADADGDEDDDDQMVAG